MHSSTTTNLVALLALVSTATAAVHDVKVGDGGLVYEPSSLKADAGDTVVFHFYPGEHNVVQGPFNTPCATTSGFYSGFINSDSGPSNTTFTITVSDTKPIWIYCSQNGHCQAGMVMAINAPSSGNTLAAYISAAGSTSTSTTPDKVGGGIVGSGSGSGSSSSASASPSSSHSAAPKSSSSSTPTSTSAAAGGSSSSGSGSSSGSSTAAAGGSSTGASTSASPSATKNAAVGAVVAGEKGVLAGVLAVLAVGAGLF